jgi:ABC-2 type transport system permease protein
MENIWALGFGIGYGALALLLGVLIGGWIFDRSGPELIAVTQVFD